MDEKKALNLLREAPLFSRLSERGLKAVQKTASLKEFKAGTKIVAEGAAGVGFYLILEGSAEVSRSGEKLAKLGSGAFFGEMSLLDGAPRSADVIAFEDTRCLVLTPWAMKSIVSANPDVALGMLEELARRLRDTDRALS
ncbi:cyclic nucleotide-binding domain-containing protein [Candidatus Bipolaricaulota bacterium]|nr:cyclic nucleotide-binding domain-containing protein [Candidatus Bipolaricaulota bacterium]